VGRYLSACPNGPSANSSGTTATITPIHKYSAPTSTPALTNAPPASVPSGIADQASTDAMLMIRPSTSGGVMR
jgi:hypothetical protein